MSQNKEYLLSEENNRLTVYPIKNMSIWDLYKKQQAAFWTVEEVDMSQDYDHFCKFNKDEQHFIKNILAFFAASDTIVNINLLERFTSDVQIMEAKIAYTYQAMMENIHGEMYSLMIETLVKDQEEKDKLMDAVNTIPCISQKAEWAFKWIDSDESFAARIVAFAIVEGIFFSGSFCSIFWIKHTKKDKMPGLTLSNEFIARDEGMHTDFACLLYSHLTEKLTQEKIHSMIKEAVEIEIEFVTKSLPCKLIGMNSELMARYIKYVADRLCYSLKYEKIYNEKNPFQWMETISLEGKSNFFENRASQYQNANILNKTSKGDFKILDDF
ncbi:Ribonucleotide reductase, small chain [seawater metagenome]|uniref:Ribonucleotide reductase, small chain n=1 Tax=seawater metagenome TaxID=1561972 RepID=A0A5E8CLI5_9ZZZZ